MPHSFGRSRLSFIRPARHAQIRGTARRPHVDHVTPPLRPPPNQSACHRQPKLTHFDAFRALAPRTAKNNFHQPHRPHRLQLDLGDTVCILRHCDDWYYGYRKGTPRTARGIFPKSYVQLVEAEQPPPASVASVAGGEPVCIGGGEPTIRRSEFVREITNVLADWRELFTAHYLSGNAACFQQLRVKIHELIRLRSQILTGNLPVDELREVRLLATGVIDTGNQLLGLDMIVRDEAGNVLDIGRTSTTHLYEQHVHAETLIRKANVSVCVFLT